MSRRQHSDARFNIRDENVEVLGKGYEAIAFRYKDKPNIIKMIGSDDDIKEIPYAQYVLLSKKYFRENPYFPRVFQVSKTEVSQDITDPNEHEWTTPKNVYMFKMEELEPLDTISADQLTAMYNRTFGSEPIAISAHVIADSVERLLRGRPPIKGTDPLLIKAVDLIKKVQARTKANIDLHIGNMMVRRTSVGPQLVITDPLVKFI